MGSRRRLGLLVLATALAACGHTMRPFSARPIVWEDADRKPFPKKPDLYESPLGWNGADKTLLMPITDALWLKLGREAIDVNAVDEVPDSSWFANRLSRAPMTPEEMARGQCQGLPPDQDFPWTVVSAKLEGQTAGVRIRSASGVGYFLEFDFPRQPEMASAADVIGSRIYHAAGFHAVCDRIVFFESKDLLVPPPKSDDTGKDETAKKKRVSRETLDAILQIAPRAPDGRFRGMASQVAEGEPLGPWKYEDVRSDDPNDVIPHEDRREVRATRVLTAWLNHYDTGENNTLAMWIPVPSGGGYVLHDTIDWNDSLGFLFPIDALTRRLGYSYYFDMGAISRDFWTFGAVERPYERVQFGKTGAILGYFDDAEFDPEDWHPGYPNPAFSRMTERDAAWMARIVARFSDAHLKAIVAEAKISHPVVVEELLRILAGRRDRILRRWLTRLSSFTDPTVRERDGGFELCLSDRAEEAGLGAPPAPSASVWLSQKQATPLPLSRGGPAEFCARLPDSPPEYLVVDFVTGRPKQSPARVHLGGGQRPQLLGLERPENDALPAAVPAAPGGRPSPTTGAPLQ
jgi:hypothetical protein